MNNTLFYKISLSACILAFLVIVLGAYVRLSDAGLGCPDWPGCYGQITAPDEAEEITRAQVAYSINHIDSGKAWKEMIHRYFAATLGLLILVMAYIAWRNRTNQQQPVLLPILLVALVIFQGLLGMWTVTLLLKPSIVTLHLLTGLLTLSLLFWLVLKQIHFQKQLQKYTSAMQLRLWARASLLVLIIQIFLGGWTSTNYAALYCIDFPTCQGQWIPDMNIKDAYQFFSEVGVNYEGGVLSHEAGVTVHFMHRLGALITFIVVSGLAITLLIKEKLLLIKQISLAILTLLLLQVSLGIANVLLLLPLPIAVSHNAIAAALLLALIVLNYVLHTPLIKQKGLTA